MAKPCLLLIIIIIKIVEITLRVTFKLTNYDIAVAIFTVK